MERFYYDQDCEFRQRPFEVATYGEIVPFIVTLTQDAYGYIWNEVPPGLYDARNNDKRIIMSFTCCLHFQDFRRSDQPPIVSARNPTGYAWQVTMLSSRSSPAIVTSNVYLLFPALGVLHVTRRMTGEKFGRMEITDDNLFDACVCDQYHNLCPPWFVYHSVFSYVTYFICCNLIHACILFHVFTSIALFCNAHVAYLTVCVV